MSIDLVLAVVAGLLGLLFGSFANVAIHRWPRKGSLVRPPSSCPSCGARIRPRDNIPILSWIALRGRCRLCGAPIPWRYPVVEIAVSALWAAVAVVHGLTWALPALLLLSWALVVAAVIDLEHRIIPNRLTYPLAPAVLALLLLAAVIDGTWGALLRAIIAGLAIPAGMLFLSEIFLRVRGQAGMGMGDVKLAISIGLVLGYLGGWFIAVGLYAAIIVSVLVAGALLIAGRARLATRIPFGPYLAAGTLLAILAGRPLAELAAGWLGLM